MTTNTLYEAKIFEGSLKVFDFPELDYTGISISILNKCTSLHHRNNTNDEERGPSMAARQKMLNDNGWTYAGPNCWALGGAFDVISIEFFEELISSDFELSYNKVFSGSNIGYIAMEKPWKDSYPPEYASHLPIEKLEYSHRFTGEHMEFKFKAEVGSNPSLPHYDIHAKKFLLKFKVNKDQFINSLFYSSKKFPQRVWSAFDNLQKTIKICKCHND